jgi:hypothetical protein
MAIKLGPVRVGRTSTVAMTVVPRRLQKCSQNHRSFSPTRCEAVDLDGAEEIADAFADAMGSLRLCGCILFPLGGVTHHL